jgi:hypothetical protein
MPRSFAAASCRYTRRGLLISLPAGMMFLVL